MKHKLAAGALAAASVIVPLTTIAGGNASAASTAPSGCYSYYWNFSRGGTGYVVYTDSSGTSRVVATYRNQAQ